MMDNPMLE